MPAVVRPMYYEPPRSVPQSRSEYSPYNTKLMSAIMTGASRELPLPTVSRISSLVQANATLQNCSYRLSRTNRSLSSDERRQIQRWLEQWEAAFTAYLSHTMPAMKQDDIMRCRILKANHLACNIMVADGPTANLDSFELDFKAIVELADVVMQTRAQASPGSDSPLNEAPGAVALDVRDPLAVVVSRCRRQPIRTRAAELLGVMSPR